MVHFYVTKCLISAKVMYNSTFMYYFLWSRGNFFSEDLIVLIRCPIFANITIKRTFFCIYGRNTSEKELPLICSKTEQ